MEAQADRSLSQFARRPDGHGPTSTDARSDCPILTHDTVDRALWESVGYRSSSKDER